MTDKSTVLWTLNHYFLNQEAWMVDWEIFQIFGASKLHLELQTESKIHKAEIKFWHK